MGGTAGSAVHEIRGGPVHGSTAPARGEDPRGDPPASTPLGDIADEVALLVDRIASAALPAPAYVDLSLEGVPAHVARVVAPGLEVWALDPDRVGRRVERWLREP